MPRRIDVVRSSRWQLASLSIPLGRGVLYVAGFQPSQLGEAPVWPALQFLAIVLLGVTALAAVVAVLARVPEFERAALEPLALLCAAYTVVLLAGDWHSGLISVVIYGAIAVAAVSRAVEITRALRVIDATLAADEPPR